VSAFEHPNPTHNGGFGSASDLPIGRETHGTAALIDKPTFI
jgi:hypothetical protein